MTQQPHTNHDNQTMSAAPRDLTDRQIMEVCESIKSRLDSHGIRLPPDCDLAQMLEHLRWLASFGGRVLYNISKHGADRRSALRALLEFEQCTGILAAVQAADRVPGGQEKLSVLRKRLNLLGGPDAPARDTLFELTVAGLLAQMPMPLEVDFAEPDIVLTDVDGYQIGIACKRPHTVARLADHIKNASRQCRQQSFPCAVVVDVSCIVASPDKGSAANLLSFNRGKELEQHLQTRLRELCETEKDAMNRAFHRGTTSVILFLHATAFVGEPLQYAYRRRTACIRHSDLGGSKDLPLLVAQNLGPCVIP